MSAGVNELLCRQLAADYCCLPCEVSDDRNHFTEHRYLDGRRRFREAEECFLKVAVINGKLLFTGQAGIIDWCRETYASTGGEWFLEAKNMRSLDDRLRENGWRIAFAHPFFLSDRPADLPAALPDGFSLCMYDRTGIEQFRGDPRFSNAYTFLPEAPDVIGAAAFCGERIAAMAGASADSPLLWQIGIDVDPAMRGQGLAAVLVSRIRDEILRQGRLPYYGTGFSHIASQRTALRAGFLPAWVEIVSARIG